MPCEHILISFILLFYEGAGKLEKSINLKLKSHRNNFHTKLTMGVSCFNFNLRTKLKQQPWRPDNIRTL